MTCPSSREPRGRRNNHRFRNYIGSVDRVVESYWTPTSLPELVWIVQAAEREGKRVHPVGTGWSFEDLAFTPDWMVDLRSLDQLLPRPDASGTRAPGLVDRGPHHGALSDYWRERQFGSGDEKLIHVEAGIRLYELNRALAEHRTTDRDGLALPTMGGATGQRLAGVISTSTHGSDYRLPPFCDLVQALHLVTTGGRELWVERGSRPVTSNDEALRAAISACPDLQIIRDDELLDAIVVSMGRFGIIYSFVLQVTPAFRIAEHSHQYPWRDVARALASGVGRGPTAGSPFGALNGLLAGEDPPADLRISGTPQEYRYLDLVFNPRKPENCWVRRRWLTRDEGDLNLPGDPDPLCHKGVANALIQAASVALKGYAGLVAAIPVYGAFKSVEINVRAAELDAMTADPHLTTGHALAAALNAIWASQMGDELNGLVDEITAMAFGGRLGNSEGAGVRGPAWQVSAGYADPTHEGDCYRGNSIEVIFGLDSRAYIDFLDAVVAEAPRHRHAGWLSVRFSRKSRALLSMHNVDHHVACSIEITSLRDIAGNDEWMRWIEQTAIRMGGRPHWGQQNDLTARQVQRLYGSNLQRWREQLERIVGQSKTFSNSYTEQRGLEPATETLMFASWLHGHKVKVERPELARVWRAGFYGRVTGNAGSENWLHFAVPTPVIVDEQRLKVGSTLLRYRASGAAHIHAVHVYDGETKIAEYDGMTSRPRDWQMQRFRVPGRPEIRWGLGISVGVRFPAAGGKLEFAGAGCDFVL